MADPESSDSRGNDLPRAVARAGNAAGFSRTNPLTGGSTIERVELIGPGPLVGTLTMPSSDSTGGAWAAVLLNSGHLHRVGPGRSYVELARRLASSGTTVLRLDFSGIGDSPGRPSSGPYDARRLEEARAAFDHLQRELGIRHFVPMGICSGADTAFELARHDARVSAAALINGRLTDATIYLDAEAELRRRWKTRGYRRRLLSPSSWLRLLTGRSDLTSLARTVIAPIRKRSAPSLPKQARLASLEELSRNGTKLLLVFSEGAIMWELLEHWLVDPAHWLRELGMSVERLRDADHVFTPIRSRQRLFEIIEDWLATATSAIGTDGLHDEGLDLNETRSGSERETDSL